MSVAPEALDRLFELVRRARSASDTLALEFMVVNDTHLLSPFRQSALWFERSGVRVLSGIATVGENTPYVQWLTASLRTLAKRPVDRIAAQTLPARLADEWQQWLPEYGLWIPLPPAPGAGVPWAGGVLFARDVPWRDEDITLFTEWVELWRCIYLARRAASARTFRAMLARTAGSVRRAPWLWLAAAAVLLALPVRISVLAPGELVPAETTVVRAPLDGVISDFSVAPNEAVRQGQALFGFDSTQLKARLEIARDALAAAQVELRQYSSQALTDLKARAALATALGAVAEKRTEVEYLQGQLARAKVLAPRAGIALFDDPIDWIGRPVSTGERILRIAAPEAKEIEAWVAVADAIPLPPGTPVRFYLSADPLTPVAGRVRYVSYDAIRRPDGTYAYRVRAGLDETTVHRIGLRGTVRLSGGSVPAAYWVLRRPLAHVREYLGV